MLNVVLNKPFLLIRYSAGGLELSPLNRQSPQMTTRPWLLVNYR